MNQPLPRRHAAPAVILAALVALGGLAPPAGAQSWSPVGPPGGDVRSLAAHPGAPHIVYLGTASGVLYRSEDSGRTWKRLEPGFPLHGTSLDDLAVAPDGTVYVGYWALRGGGGGVARSDDGGRTFIVLPGIAGQAVKALALAPSDPETVIAGTLAGVFRSQNGGRSWRRISAQDHPELRNVNSIAIDPADPDTVYVGTWHLPWKTTDGGRTWRSIHSGIINDSDIMTLTFDRRSPRTLYATACSGIYRTKNAAGRWTKVRGIPNSSRRTRAFAQHPQAPDTLFAGTTEGLWTTEDGGASWTLRTSRQLVVNALLTQPDGSLLVGTDGAGVLRSTDGGRTWTDSNRGFSERFVSRVLFAPIGGRVVVGVTGDRSHGGVFSAPAPEGPWTRLAPGLEGREVLTIALAGDTVLAGTDDGVYRSQGQAWRRLPTVVDGADLHPHVTDLIALGPRLFLAATSQGLLRSTDGGDLWERHRLGVLRTVERIAVSSGPESVLLAATPIGFFESQDQGASWAPVAGRIGDARVHDLAFLPGSDRVVFVATPRGLYRSEDGGRAWWPRGGGLPLLDITGLALAGDGRTVYASEFTQGGLWRSDDAGETWDEVPTDGLATNRIWALALDPERPERLLAATPSGGLHQWRPAASTPSLAGDAAR
ncbi:MAG: hypothetical protein PVJ73_04790 [Acidobacteriota bacterium]|jgi:photosystem II stability/assembly factor-like uncharacterized protein